MVCEHLATLEAELLAAGYKETFRGPAWGEGTREWVYFKVLLDLPAIRRRLALPEFVVAHEHPYMDVQSGPEYGFECEHCHDAVIGVHPKFDPDAPKVG